MVAVALLLQLQTVPPPTQYSSPAVQALVARAAQVNQAAAANWRAYQARFESELAIEKSDSGDVEGGSSIEQSAGTYRVIGDSVILNQEGYRLATTGIPLPAAQFLNRGWILPWLWGDRYQSFGAPYGRMSPLAADREMIYRYGGGDTVSLATPDGGTQTVVRIRVWPAETHDARFGVFRGDMYLDPESAALVRLRGQFMSIGGPPEKRLTKLLNSLAKNSALVDLYTTEVAGVGRVPTYQWIELQVLLPLSSEMYAMQRVVTRLREVEAIPGTVVPPAPDTSGAGPLTFYRTQVSRDSAAHYRGWLSQPWQEPDEVLTTDLSNVGPLELRPTGPPVLMWRSPTTLNWFRVDRVEGLYIGPAATLRLRDKAPGLQLFGDVGYAWAEDVVRWDFETSLKRSGWEFVVAGGRELAIATKFVDPLDYGRGTRPIFSTDNYDYIDRLEGQLRVVRTLSRQKATIADLSVALANDRVTPATVETGFVGQTFPPNPGVAPGTFMKTRARVLWNQGISQHFIAPGVGGRIIFENGVGDLDYNRIQGELVLRANWRRFLFTVVGDAGMLFGTSNPPPQQLFLIGGSASLPGYEYDAFAGDRAYLVKGLIRIPIPLLTKPMPISKRVSLPALAPAFNIQLYVGQTWASDSAVVNSVSQLGTRPGTDPGTTVAYSAAGSDGARSSTELRVTFFGTLIGLGFARAFEPDAKWQFQFTLAQTF